MVEQVFGEAIIQPTINNRAELTVIVNNVKVTFLSYPFLLIGPCISEQYTLPLGQRDRRDKSVHDRKKRSVQGYVDLYFIVKDHHAALEEIIDIAEQKFGGQFNSRLFLEQLLFMDDIQDYNVEFLVIPPAPSDILEFLNSEVRRLSLANEAH